MKKYLIRKNRKHSDFVYLEADGHLLRMNVGKVGLKSIKSTEHCGTKSKAEKEVVKRAKIYLENGYIEAVGVSLEPIIFDKADWHYGGDFPENLPNHQAYIHTGFYIGWLILNSLFDSNFMRQNKTGIKKFLIKKITSASFFEEYMDGVFVSNDLTEEGVSFTLEYFGQDFTTSSYLGDLEESLCSNLPTFYHLEDSWENFEVIRKIIDKRYKQWVKLQAKKATR